MKLIKARIQNYRSIFDTGLFDIELIKTILVGPNESGKTVILQALQHLNPPDGTKTFNVLRDFPRSLYQEIKTGKIKIENVEVVTGHFALDNEDQAFVPERLRREGLVFVFERYMNNDCNYYILDAPECTRLSDIREDLNALIKACKAKLTEEDYKSARVDLTKATEGLTQKSFVFGTAAEEIKAWVDSIDDMLGSDFEKNIKAVNAACMMWSSYEQALVDLEARVPKVVLYSNIFRVKPNIHLGHLASRLESGILDDTQYDYGNSCLLKLLGFSARELSDLGEAPEPDADEPTSLEAYRDQLDMRKYQLNAASKKLTTELNSVWNGDDHQENIKRVRVTADGQYLKVVIEDDDGEEVELDQRSEGFQWLVSFFIVFFLET